MSVCERCKFHEKVKGMSDVVMYCESFSAFYTEEKEKCEEFKRKPMKQSKL